MVYCGKASQGCQSCRTRRIKCDKVRPQCTQCVRVTKVCPGYRDQLELMFRDESTKVIQKAHAQWGVSDSFEMGEASGSSPISTSPSSSISTRSRASISGRSSSKASTPPADDSLTWITAPPEICATRSDQAVRFFIEHYLVGHPDEPKASRELQGVGWIHAPQIQHIMAAVGLASMSNLTGDKEMQVMAREKYGLALRLMVASIQNLETIDLTVSMRTIIILALFEVIRGDSDSSMARTHLMGAAALLRTLLPRSGMRAAPASILRALLQFCFSMLIPCLVAANNLPDIFFDWVSMGESMASALDRPSIELIRVIAQLVHLSAFVGSHVLVDGRPKTSEVILEALDIDAQLDAWEQRQEGIWLVMEEYEKDLPPEAVFDGCYHVYTDMWTARVWNHYRWARTMVNEMILRFVESYPVSSGPLVSRMQEWQSRGTIVRVARDILVSIPTHYRHPGLEPRHRKLLERTSGGAGMGAAGIPTLLFQIKVAGCAPSVPSSYRSWAGGILETVWADTGIRQAKTHAGSVSKAQERDSQEAVDLGADPDEEMKPRIHDLASPFASRYQAQQQEQREHKLPHHSYLGVQMPDG